MEQKLTGSGANGGADQDADGRRWVRTLVLAASGGCAVASTKCALHPAGSTSSRLPANAERRALWALVSLSHLAVIVYLSAATQCYAGDYVGSNACARCHAETYAHFSKTGHAHIVNPVGDPAQPGNGEQDGGPASANTPEKRQPPEYPFPMVPDGKPAGPHAPAKREPPAYPFSAVPEPPPGYTWDDIAYVLGGYGWKARFVDERGYLVTGAQAQYNLSTGEWVPFCQDQPPGSKPYSCAACHTTGWQPVTGNGGAHQHGLPGIMGTWALPGIQCERCHGPGARHVASGGQSACRVDTTAELCGQCHYVDGQPRVEAQNGLLMSEQYDQLLNSPHHELGCGACHDAHRSVRYEQGGVRSPTCTPCHQEQRVRIKAMAEIPCARCHMPRASLSEGTTPEDGFGNMHSHTFALSVEPVTDMFTREGRFVQVDAAGNAIMAVRFACAPCHDGKTAEARPEAWMQKNARRVHRGP